jgi:thymidylate synthase
MSHLKTRSIRHLFQKLLEDKQFTTVNREGSMTDLVGNTTIEIVSANFIADEPSIFGDVNWDYVKREEEWYYSQSLNVNDIPGGAPAVWKAVADQDGFINSNYGHLIWSEKNGHQYECAKTELKINPESRRAIMIYTRPSIWTEYNTGEQKRMSDFICTNTVQYLVRDGHLHAVVQMRSNDAVFGYKGDRAWQMHVLAKLAGELGYPVGNLYWNVGSLHVYARHYYLVDPVNYPKV